MIDTLAPFLKDNYVIPVMDRTDDDVRLWHLSHLISQGVLMRAQGKGEVYSLKGGERLLGEVLFADHRHSFLTQIADVCSYLRHTCDRSRAGTIDTPFRRRIAEIGESLTPAIAYEGVYCIQFDDKPMGPESIDHFLQNDDLLAASYG